jgi:UPF0176 protein
MKTLTHSVLSAYRFVALKPEAVSRLQERLNAFAAERDLRGLCLLGAEGVNFTVSAGDPATAEAFKLLLRAEIADLVFKEAPAAKHPFLTFKVKIRREIVTLGRPDLIPSPAQPSGHLTPREWNEALHQPETIVLDTRNDYEVAIGKFKTARDLGIKEFREFPDAVRAAGLDKNRKVLLYCTGGIRCEKAILEMRRQGFEDVHQLAGGILNYLKEYPDSEFDGECFVFDYRVAVDRQLRPSQRYRLCPHCGQPADLPIRCAQCDSEAVICRRCAGGAGPLADPVAGPVAASSAAHLAAPLAPTCSKNCAHHLALGTASRKPHLQERRKRGG